MRPQVLILAGDGINCENETARAFELAGASASIRHINEIISIPSRLLDYDGLALPGGFSFGDDLGSGQIMAIKIRAKLMNEWNAFIGARRPVIGICNGFQILTKLGALPGGQHGRVMALANNIQGTFINRWVTLEVDEKSPCLWTKNLRSRQFELPIRHGEGRVVFDESSHLRVLNSLESNGQIPLRYTEDVNGSTARIAGICDPTGCVFGLMPHPEANVINLTHPVLGQGTRRFEEGNGLALFRNAVFYMKERQRDIPDQMFLSSPGVLG